MASDAPFGFFHPPRWSLPSPDPDFPDPATANSSPPFTTLPASDLDLYPGFDAFQTSDHDPSSTNPTATTLFGDGLPPLSSPPSSNTAATASTLLVPEHLLQSNNDEGNDPAQSTGYHKTSQDASREEDVWKRLWLRDSEQDDFGDNDDDGTRYELRPSARIFPLARGATWLDRDNSGDYDPSGRNHGLVQRPVKRKRRSSIDTSGSDHERRRTDTVKRPPSYLTARQNGCRWVITLHLPSERGKTLLSVNTDSVPVGYDEYHNFLDEDCLSDQMSSNGLDSADPRLRRRSSRRTARASSEVDPNISLGHPAARGCKACLKLGQPCPLLEPNGTYPCYLCVEDDCDCELVVEPPRKRACERCKKRRTRCSYQDNDEHDQPCQDCQHEGFHCVAGAAIDPTRTRIGLDGLPATIHEKDPQYKRAAPRSKNDISQTPQVRSRYLTCTRCRQEGLRCGLRKAKTEVPCKNCKATGSRCQIKAKTDIPQVDYLPVREHKLNVPAKTQRPEAFSVLKDDAQSWFAQLEAKSNTTAPYDKSTPRNSDEHHSQHFRRDSGFSVQSRPPSGKLSTIRTRLAHPLLFNSTSGCNWCDDPLYGLFGLGFDDYVKVRIWPDGKGCTEIGRQTKMPGLDGSRMCPDCTMDFVLVLTCEGHRLRPISSGYSDDLTMSAVLEALDTSKSVAQRRSIEKLLCLTCPSLATMECCTKSADWEGPGSGAQGCGLRFCDTCALLFNELFANNLSDMVKQINEADKETFPNGLRADYPFYAEDSYLVKQVLIG